MNNNPLTRTHFENLTTTGSQLSYLGLQPAYEKAYFDGDLDCGPLDAPRFYGTGCCVRFNDTPIPRVNVYDGRLV